MQHLNAANDFSMCLKEKYILHVALLFQSLCWIYDIQQFLAFFSTIAVPCKEYFANYWGCLLQRFNLMRASRFSGVSENGVIGSPSKILPNTRDRTVTPSTDSDVDKVLKSIKIAQAGQELGRIAQISDLEASTSDCVGL